ncbi:MAG: septal ring lytic transglycosylase RlpA family protein [Ferruginibacter sp.]
MKEKFSIHLFIKAVVFTLFIILFTPTVQAQKGGKPKASSRSRKSNKILYGQASFYANKFNGRKTASGEIFSQSKLTAACNVLPLGTWIQVTNLKNGKIIIVKTNDRLHPNMRRLIDLTRTGAKKLGYISRGLTRVKIEVLDQKLYK